MKMLLQGLPRHLESKAWGKLDFDVNFTDTF